VLRSYASLFGAGCAHLICWLFSDELHCIDLVPVPDARGLQRDARAFHEVLSLRHVLDEPADRVLRVRRLVDTFPNRVRHVRIVDQFDP
jgi:hypothetical protein